MTPALFALALIASPPGPLDGPGTFLLSLTGVRLGADQYISGFSLDTWAVEPLATCQIPSGWTISAGSSGDPGGSLSGFGGLGVAWLDRAHAGDLKGIVLVRLSGPVTRKAGGEAPATFSGHVLVGRYGVDAPAHKVTLAADNVRLTPASRCPAPRF